MCCPCSSTERMLFIRLFQIFILFGFEIFNSIEYDQLLCYSCKGLECEQIPNQNEKKIICNKKTQLCWAGFIDQQPYRTCASRYCTPNDVSLESDIHIETCCRSDLCNAVSLSRSYKKMFLLHPTESTTTTQIIDEKSLSKGESNDNDVKSYDKGFSTRIASISSILLFVMPLLLVLFL